jgi:short-subunit dehydrogenase
MLAERGAKVVLGARGLDRLEALARRIAAAGGEVAYAQTDVRRREDLTSLVNLAVSATASLTFSSTTPALPDLPSRRPARGGLGKHDRHQHQRCSLRHRRSAAGVSQAGFRTFRQHRFYGRHKTSTRTMAVYAGTKFAVRAISEGLRQEAGDKLRVTIISPGFVNTNFAESMTNPEMKAQIRNTRMDKMGISPDAIARAIVFAIEQPPMLTWARLLSVPLRRLKKERRVIQRFRSSYLTRRLPVTSNCNAAE